MGMAGIDTFSLNRRYVILGHAVQMVEACMPEAVEHFPVEFGRMAFKELRRHVAAQVQGIGGRIDFYALGLRGSDAPFKLGQAGRFVLYLNIQGNGLGERPIFRH